MGTHNGNSLICHLAVIMCQRFMSSCQRFMRVCFRRNLIWSYKINR